MEKLLEKYDKLPCGLSLYNFYIVIIHLKDDDECKIQHLHGKTIHIIVLHDKKMNFYHIGINEENNMRLTKEEMENII